MGLRRIREGVWSYKHFLITEYYDGKYEVGKVERDGEYWPCTNREGDPLDFVSLAEVQEWCDEQAEGR